MKKWLCGVFLIFLAKNGLAQCCPYVGYISTHPQTLDASMFIRLIAHATTPNLATEISRSVAVNTLQNTFQLQSCYYMGSQPGPELFLDTFVVGYLNPGTYLVSFKAFMSSSQSSCVAVDSNSSSVYTMVVSPFVGVREQQQDNGLRLYPNPVQDKLTVELMDPSLQFAPLTLQNVFGQNIYEGILSKQKEEIDMGALPPGLYFLKMGGKADPTTYKVVKGE